MKETQANNEERSDNFLDFVPTKNIEWQQDEQGKVYLIKEKSKNRIVKKIIDLFGKSQFFHIHLDEIGTSAWLLTDGKRTIYEISKEMKAQFGDRLQEAEQRVCFFFAMLKKSKFVDFL